MRHVEQVATAVELDAVEAEKTFKDPEGGLLAPSRKPTRFPGEGGQMLLIPKGFDFPILIFCLELS